MQQYKSIEQNTPFIFLRFYKSISSSIGNMAEEEIVKINQKLQKMIEKSDVVCFKSINKYFSMISLHIFRMKV